MAEENIDENIDDLSIDPFKVPQSQKKQPKSIFGTDLSKIQGDFLGDMSEWIGKSSGSSLAEKEAALYRS